MVLLIELILYDPKQLKFCMLQSGEAFSNLLVMGKSGAGKQPRIDVLIQEFGLKQLSTGDLFRKYLGKFAEIQWEGDIRQFYDESTDTFLADDKILEKLGPVAEWEDSKGVLLGLKAKYFVEAGKFAPDSLTNEIFEAEFVRHGCKGLVLDGFPRTVAQAELLLDLVVHYGTNIDAVVLVENEDDLIVQRTIGRRICPSCKKVFHLEHKPPREGKFCVECGTEVIHRVDDHEDKIRTRLEEYYNKAEPALKFLKSEGIPVALVPGNLKCLLTKRLKSLFSLPLRIVLVSNRFFDDCLCLQWAI